MINPIKIVINKLEPIKIYIQDFPRSFNAYFASNIYLKTSAKIRQLLRFVAQNHTGLKNHIKIVLGVGAKPTVNVSPNSSIKLRSAFRLIFMNNFGTTSSVKFNTKIRTFVRMLPQIWVGVQSKSISIMRTDLRMKSIKHDIGLNSVVKIIVAIFYKHDERGYMTWEEVDSSDSSRTWQTFLTREI